MDTSAKKAWVAKQIREHAPVVPADPKVAARLAVAAGALRPGSTNRQAFGLELPADVTLDDLYGECMTLLAGWATVLDEKSASELALMMGQIGLTPAATSTPARTSGSLQVLLPAVVEDLATDESVSRPSVLAELEGARAEGGERLLDIACMRRATAGSFELEGVREAYGWAHASSVVLTYDRAAGSLRCQLSFELTRAPLRPEIDKLLETIQRELLFTGWGLNLEWDRYASQGTFIVRVEPKVIEHQLTYLVG